MEALKKELMTSVDHAWWRMESPANHMMIGSVLIFEDRLDLDRFIEVLQTRLVAKFNRFRQRIVHENGFDFWQDDPYFAIENHVISTGFPHDGGRRELQSLASRLMSMGLESNQPLWSINVIGHYGKGSALIIRIHHCIADGMSLMQLIISLTDDCRDPGEVELCTGKPTRGARVHHDSLRDLITHPGQWLTALEHGLSGAEELAAVTLQAADPKTALKGHLSGHKVVAWSEPFPLADVKRLGKCVHATVNDILMATAAGVIRNELLRHGEVVDDLNLHVAVPFNLRPLDQPVDKLGNQFGLVVVPLPVGIADPVLRLQAVKASIERLKQSYQAQAFFFLLEALGSAPSVLEQTALDILSRKASLVMTNVPGTRHAIYLAGAKVSQALAWVPQSGDIGVGLSILTYNDEVHFGFIADKALISDPNRVTADFEQEFRLLESRLQEPGEETGD